MKQLHWPTLAIMGIIIGFVCIIAVQSLDASFVMDDIDQLNQTATQHSLTDALKRDCYGLYRPVKTSLFYGLSKAAPDSPFEWHIVGLLIYAAAVLLFHALINRLFAGGWALVATAIWALAPTQVSSYAWSSCLNILIMTVAVLAALLLHDRHCSHPSSSSGSYCGGIALLYALAFFSYEAAIVLPGLLLTWSLLRKHELRTRKTRDLILTCGGTGLLLLLIRHAMNGAQNIENPSIHGFTPSQLSWASGKIIWDHFSLWHWPYGQQSICGTLHNDRPHLLTARFILPWVWISTLAAGAFLLRRRCPAAIWGWMFFGISFFPMSNLVPLFNGPYADYYLIVPSIGLTITLTALLRKLYETRSHHGFIRGVSLTLCLLLAATRLMAVGSSFSWSKAWKTETGLFANTLISHPDAYTAKTSLARCLLQQGDLDAAERLARESSEQAPWFRQANYVLINILLKANRQAEALAETEKVLLSDPPQVYPWAAMGFLAENYLNNRAKAIDAYSKVQQLDWQTASEDAYLNLTRLLSLENRDPEALAVLREGHARASGAEAIASILPIFEANPELFRAARDQK